MNIKRSVENERALHFARSAPAIALTEDHITSVLLVRRARDEALGENLFSDPAWDILLELFAARLGSRQMTVSHLASAIGTPLTITARWIAALQERGLVQGATNDTEGRPVELTEDGLTRMTLLASRWASAFLAIT